MGSIKNFDGCEIADIEIADIKIAGTVDITKQAIIGTLANGS